MGINTINNIINNGVVRLISLVRLDGWIISLVSLVWLVVLVSLVSLVHLVSLVCFIGLVSLNYLVG